MSISVTKYIILQHKYINILRQNEISTEYKNEI